MSGVCVMGVSMGLWDPLLVPTFFRICCCCFFLRVFLNSFCFVWGISLNLGHFILKLCGFTTRCLWRIDCDAYIAMYLCYSSATEANPNCCSQYWHALWISLVHLLFDFLYFITLQNSVGGDSGDSGYHLNSKMM